MCVRVTHSASRPTRTKRRGAILVAALWIMVVLTGTVLVLARWARVESSASANRLAALRAQMAARAGEQYVLAQLEEAAGDAVYAMESPAEAVPVGIDASGNPGAYFYILRPDYEDDNFQDYGVADEGGKIDLNSATRDTLLKLPGMTADVADAIIDWRDADDTPGESGAESDYYQSLPTPYRAKNAPFESPEELLLVRGVTPDLLWGMDLNHNGYIDDDEANAGGSGMGGVSGIAGQINNTARGIMPFVTVFGAGQLGGTTTTTTTTTTGGTGGAGGTGGTGTTGGTGAGGTSNGQASTLINVNDNNSTQQLLDLLRNSLSGDRYNRVSSAVTSGRPYTSLLDFYTKSGMTADEFAAVSSRLTTGTATRGQVNVNSAPKEVLMCLPGLDESDADALVAARQAGADTSSIAWVTQTLSRDKAAAIGAQITGQSYRYTADIVGVSGDGRAYHRVRVVVDSGLTPPRVIYRRDLTEAGWPLPEGIRLALRSNQTLVTPPSNRTVAAPTQNKS